MACHDRPSLVFKGAADDRALDAMIIEKWQRDHQAEISRYVSKSENVQQSVLENSAIIFISLSRTYNSYSEALRSVCVSHSVFLFGCRNHLWRSVGEARWF